MRFPWQKARDEELKRKELEIQKVRKQYLKPAATAAENASKLNRYIEDNPDDVAALIFAATGGEKRMK